MKIFYVANNQLPTKKAHGVQIMKMCEAFSKHGVPCELICPERYIDPTIVQRDPFLFYGVDRIFSLRRLPSFDSIHWQWIPGLGKFFFRMQQNDFARKSRKYLKEHASDKDIIYSRDSFVLNALADGPWKLFWEIHNLPRKFNKRSMFNDIFRRINGVFVITKGLKDHLSKYYSNEFTVVPDGMDVKDFDMHQSTEELRNELSLPIYKKIVMYAGHLYGWKGIHTLIRASRMLPENFLVVAIGGLKEDVDIYAKDQSDNPRILFAGYQPHQRIPKYLKAADILVLPNSGSKKISSLFTSPLKMFEYMAAEKPIIASDLPSIREVLDDENAFLVPPDDPDALREKILHVADNYPEASQKAQKASKDALQYDWSLRAQRVLSVIHDKI